MFCNKKGFALNIDRMVRRLFFLGTALFLISSCTGVSSVKVSVNTVPTMVFTSLVTPTQNAAQSPSAPTAQQVDQSPSATPPLTTAHTPSSSPAPLATQPPSATPIPPTTQPPSVSTPTVINPTPTHSKNEANIKTVFIILMENHNWSDILNNPSAAYINQTLLPQASYAQQYYNPSGLHPSEPNYIWLEAGTSLGITNDDPPASNHQSTTDHLVTYLDKAGVSWKAYSEGITGKVCPLENEGLFVPKHNPMLFFDDVTGNNDPNSAYCIAHVRPYSELSSDLQNNSVAQYNFITPNQCDNMHNSNGCQTQDQVKNGDTWLSEQIPIIMSSDAYKQGGVIFITWDESEGGNHPIGMIALSPLAKGGGYSNSLRYSHSSTIRTIQEIFNITPLLGYASSANDLSDLFTQFP